MKSGWIRFGKKAGIYRRDGNLFFDADRSALPGVKQSSAA